jgi:hypothetical protein
LGLSGVLSSLSLSSALREPKGEAEIGELGAEHQILLIGRLESLLKPFFAWLNLLGLSLIGLKGSLLLAILIGLMGLIHFNVI